MDIEPEAPGTGVLSIRGKKWFKILCVDVFEC